jgi:hypothetical protein
MTARWPWRWAPVSRKILGLVLALTVVLALAAWRWDRSAPDRSARCWQTIAKGPAVEPLAITPGTRGKPGLTGLVVDNLHGSMPLLGGQLRYQFDRASVGYSACGWYSPFDLSRLFAISGGEIQFQTPVPGAPLEPLAKARDEAPAEASPVLASLSTDGPHGRIDDIRIRIAEPPGLDAAVDLEGVHGDLVFARSRASGLPTGQGAVGAKSMRTAFGYEWSVQGRVRFEGNRIQLSEITWPGVSSQRINVDLDLGRGSYTLGLDVEAGWQWLFPELAKPAPEESRWRQVWKMFLFRPTDAADTVVPPAAARLRFQGHSRGFRRGDLRGRGHMAFDGGGLPRTWRISMMEHALTSGVSFGTRHRPFAFDFTIENDQLTIAPFAVMTDKAKICIEGTRALDPNGNARLKAWVALDAKVVMEQLRIPRVTDSMKRMLVDEEGLVPIPLIVEGNWERPSVSLDANESKIEELRRAVAEGRRAPFPVPSACKATP